MPFTSWVRARAPEPAKNSDADVSCCDKGETRTHRTQFRNGANGITAADSEEHIENGEGCTLVSCETKSDHCEGGECSLDFVAWSTRILCARRNGEKNQSAASNALQVLELSEQGL